MSLLHRFLFVIAVTFVWVPLPASAINVTEVETDIGVKVLLVEDHSLPIIAMSFAFEGGTAQDPEGKSGALNLMTSLFDEGAGDLDAEAFQNRMEDLAAHMRFSAGRDYVFGSLRTLSSNADEAFDMLRLAMVEPRFEDKPLNRIRDQIISGIRSANNNPDTEASKKLRAAIYPDNHPYQRRDRGTESDLSSVTADDLRALKRALFTLDTLKISVVGDITEIQLKAKINKIFGRLERESKIKKIDVIDLNLGDVVHVEVDRPQTRFTLIGKGVSRDDPDYLAAYLVNQVLGGSGLTSRLSNEVREKRGLAYSISTGLTNHQAVDIFTGSVATRTDFADQSLAVMKAELKRMADEGLTPDELSLAKSYTIGVYALNFDGSMDIARTLTAIQTQGLPTDYISKRADLINAVTIEDTKRVAKRLLGEGKYTLLRLGPK